MNPLSDPRVFKTAKRWFLEGFANPKATFVQCIKMEIVIAAVGLVIGFIYATAMLLTGNLK